MVAHFAIADRNDTPAHQFAEDGISVRFRELVAEQRLEPVFAANAIAIPKAKPVNRTTMFPLMIASLWTRVIG
jgi:hypothetical protein